MRRDEFNNVSVNNDKQLRGVEFGSTSRNEIFSQRENTINHNELNATQAKDELNEGVSEGGQGSHHDDFTQEELRKQFKDNTSNSSESSSTSSSSSSSSSNNGGTIICVGDDCSSSDSSGHDIDEDE